MLPILLAEPAFLVCSMALGHVPWPQYSKENQKHKFSNAVPNRVQGRHPFCLLRRSFPFSWPVSSLYQDRRIMKAILTDVFVVCIVIASKEKAVRRLMLKAWIEV